MKDLDHSAEPCLSFGDRIFLRAVDAPRAPRYEFQYSRAEGYALVTSPYIGLPNRQFWRTGVRDADWNTIGDLYRKKFPITTKIKIMTASSCFAQHIGKNLKKNGLSVIEEELAPRRTPSNSAKAFGCDTYSARNGNIYTARQLLREAFGRGEPSDIVWEKDGRYYDAMRPSVGPKRLDSQAEVLAHRKDHLARER